MTPQNGTDARESSATSEREIDYRFSLANERTFLAWQRTSLGLLAAAVALNQFQHALVHPALQHAVGMILGGLAIFTSVAGVRRWHCVERAMHIGKSLPRDHLSTALAIGIGVVGLIVCCSFLVEAITV